MVLGDKAGLGDPLTLHNFYVPAGGDEPDPEINVKFKHKLDFLDEMRAHAALRPAQSQHAILVLSLIHIFPAHCLRKCWRATRRPPLNCAISWPSGWTIGRANSAL